MQNFDKNENFVGKVRANFLGTEFRIYNDGKNAKESPSLKQLR